MSKKLSLRLLAAVSAIWLAGCGHAIKQNTGTPPSANTAPFSLFLLDATPGLPAGFTLLSFQLTFHSAALQPGNVSLFSTPLVVQGLTLQDGPTVLATTNVKAGTYTSLDFLVSTPVFTVANTTASTVSGCPGGAICQFTGSAVPATISLTGSPFPLQVTAGTPVALQADLLPNSIIQSDLSQVLSTSSFAISQLPAVGSTGTAATVDNLFGEITAIGLAQFTVVNQSTSLSAVVNITGTTTFENFNQFGCSVSPQSFVCLKVGQLVSVDADVLGSGAIQATTITAEDDVGFQDLEGVVVATNPALTQFSVVPLDVEPSNSGVSVGSLITVQIIQPASFTIDADDLFVPGNLSFQSPSDVFVGQEILLQRIQVFAGPGGGQIVNTDGLRLRMSQFSAKVSTVAAPSFTMNSLPSLFVASGTSLIQALTSSQTVFQGVSGATGLAAGTQVTLRGLLFGNAGSPTMVMEKVKVP